MIVRTHNIEHDYYAGLAKAEQRTLKRWYLGREAKKLAKYESVLSNATSIAAISPSDTSYFQQRFGNAFYLPAFHPFHEVTVDDVVGDYAFYHGNLAVAENDEAACFLTERVFPGIPLKLIVAGSNPTDRLRKAVARTPNVRLMTGLAPDEIHQYIARARVNVLPTFQSTGIKLKLLASLFLGKACLVNSPMVSGTGLEPLCTIADTADEFRSKLVALTTETTWNADRLELRKQLLEKRFSNRTNVLELVGRLFG